MRIRRTYMTIPNDHVRHLPLRLCEVLEKEFVATNGATPSIPSWLLRHDDVDFAKLLECLRAPTAADISLIGVLRKHLVAAGVTVLSGNVWTLQEQHVVV